MARIRVVLADDHHAVLTEVRQELGEEFEVVAAVGDGGQAVEAVRRLDPDVLILDISMPVLNGLQVASRLKADNCRTKIVFLTIHEDPDFFKAALVTGAAGYVTKSRLCDLVPAIREALLGRTFVSQSVKDWMPGS